MRCTNVDDELIANLTSEAGAKALLFAGVPEEQARRAL
jgi:hypothetical protein